MLNELYHLAIALGRAGISPNEWHKELKPLPNTSKKKTMLPALYKFRLPYCRH